MERCKVLEILHEHVQDKSKLHPRRAVVAYEETAEGVIVKTDDGVQHHGHILIGADGIHSKVRKLMANKISQTNELLAEEINQGFWSSNTR
jgi:2-polyprenyl-6-methoxyphenol hydroxylase-like FAD-dependent oxidoreductase